VLNFQVLTDPSPSPSRKGGETSVLFWPYCRNFCIWANSPSTWECVSEYIVKRTPYMHSHAIMHSHAGAWERGNRAPIAAASAPTDSFREKFHGRLPAKPYAHRLGVASRPSNSASRIIECASRSKACFE